MDRFLGYLAVQTRDDRAWDRLGRYPLPVPIQRQDTAASVLRVGGDPEALALLVDIADLTGAPTAPIVASVRHTRPNLTVLAWCPPADLGSAACRDLLRSGADGLVVQASTPYEEQALVQLIPRGDVAFHDWLEGSLDRVSPAGCRPLVSFCLHAANAGTTVPVVAAHFRMARRTLTAHLSRAGLPPARELLEWGDLLRAAWALEHSALTVEQVALRNNFASASAFRAALKRTALATPHQLRAVGSFGRVLRCFEHRLKIAHEARVR